MGKTRKVYKGYSSGFVPEYRHVVETVAESEGFGKCIGLNVDGHGRSVMPIRTLSLLKMSYSERRDLEVKLKTELEQVRKLNRKIASFSLDRVVHPQATDVRNHQIGAKRLATAEVLRVFANDEAMTPGKKKGHSGRNGPRTKGAPLAARKAESMKLGHPQNTNFVALMKQCETLLSRLMVQPHAWIFNNPVDVVAHKVPDYYDVIKHPMDLGTVKSKLLSNHYSTPMEFAADVRLTFKNARTFNPPKHDVHIMAEIMSKYFEVRWKSIEKKLPPTADDSMASKLSVIIEPESAFVLPAKKQKTVSMEAKAKPEQDKPAMSDVEKQKLGTELEELIAELPDNFLKESTLNSTEVTVDEIEIDIDALSDGTLFTLPKLLDDYLFEKNRRRSSSQDSDIEVNCKCFCVSALCSIVIIALNVYLCTNNFHRRKRNLGLEIRLTCFAKVTGELMRMLILVEMIRLLSLVHLQFGLTRMLPKGIGTAVAQEVPVENQAPNLLVRKTLQPAKLMVPVSQFPQENLQIFKKSPGETYMVKMMEFPVSSDEPYCRQEGESAPPDRQVSPEKLYRAALLRSRFADIIIKAKENTTEKGMDSERLKLEEEELERRRREGFSKVSHVFVAWTDGLMFSSEKARLKAEAKAAEEARRKAEAETAAEARRQRELEREAARQALQQMEKTIDINENSQFVEDLEMFRAGPDEQLQSLIDEASPDNSQNGLGSFKFPANSNPLEKLGLYMKNDDEEEEEVQPESLEHEQNDTEEGEID
ncbi:hypothetical protein SASPL_117847 [Salvia splendens]|uniref:Uncharacterized protein n=1 Tax=Salvia splendens TaxID=180675 RepID=A0A8X8XZ64_SALSN|nr:hypothetical protein SASPL_117847 [Salvia splendens]